MKSLFHLPSVLEALLVLYQSQRIELVQQDFRHLDAVFVGSLRATEAKR